MAPGVGRPVACKKECYICGACEWGSITGMECGKLSCLAFPFPIYFCLFLQPFPSLSCLAGFGWVCLVGLLFFFFLSFLLSFWLFRGTFRKVSSIYASNYPRGAGTNCSNYYLRVIWGDLKPETGYKRAG